MNTIKARCGHAVPTEGAPGSAARRACEKKLCPRCEKPALIGLRSDGTLAAVDLDSDKRSIKEYLASGYTIKQVPVDEALKMAREQWGMVKG